MRLRANKHLSSLGEFVTDWRKGKFTREHTSKEVLLVELSALSSLAGLLESRGTLTQD